MLFRMQYSFKYCISAEFHILFHYKNFLSHSLFMVVANRKNIEILRWSQQKMPFRSKNVTKNFFHHMITASHFRYDEIWNKMRTQKCILYFFKLISSTRKTEYQFLYSNNRSIIIDKIDSKKWIVTNMEHIWNGGDTMLVHGVYFE